MERPTFKPVGMPVEELDTPALVVDLDALEQNIETLHSFFRDSNAKVRPHVAAHMCPAIAHKQLAAGGTVGGISVTTVGQAEVFARQEFDDIFVANEVVTKQKMARLCALAHHVKITVGCLRQAVLDLSEAAHQSGVTVNVLVDGHTRLNRGGVDPGQPAVDLAGTVHNAPSLNFAGLTTYEGAILTEDAQELGNL